MSVCMRVREGSNVWNVIAVLDECHVILKVSLHQAQPNENRRFYFFLGPPKNSFLFLFFLVRRIYSCHLRISPFSFSIFGFFIFLSMVLL